MNTPDFAPQKQHVLTIGLEDYFHVGAFRRLIQPGKWYRFETRLERSTLRTLELLGQFNIKATFFVLGWIADTLPEVVKAVASRGHEVASRGYYHRGVRELTPSEFREDLHRSQAALERASGTKILGYRVGRQWFTPSDFWVLEVLADEGYAYDSSLIPIYPSLRSQPWRRFVHQHQCGDKVLWEFPFSTWSCMGWCIPIAGGNYFRQLPHTLVKRAVAQWHRRYDAPFVMYFHVWELDHEQPKINAASRLAKMRHYRNLSKMPWVLTDYFQHYRFGSIAEYLGLRPGVDNAPAATDDHHHLEDDADSRLRVRESSPSVPPDPTAIPKARRRMPITLVIPCFNEHPILPYLANTLRSLEVKLGSAYEFRFIFVDDGSTDETWKTLQDTFGRQANCTLLRHERNRGPAAAILTGIRQARTDIVGSIDCDCTYDPHELPLMIEMLTENVDMVTASPYHPHGRVQNVPAWRLSLSKVASFLYRRVLRQKLHTYTSCFRIYRRRAVAEMQLKQEGYLGITEMLGKLDLQGGRIVEYPTTLEVRMFGQSKMKVVHTILGHLGLLGHLLCLRLLQSRQTVHGATPEARMAPQASDLDFPIHDLNRSEDDTTHVLSG